MHNTKIKLHIIQPLNLDISKEYIPKNDKKRRYNIRGYVSTKYVIFKKGYLSIK